MISAISQLCNAVSKREHVSFGKMKMVGIVLVAENTLGCSAVALWKGKCFGSELRQTRGLNPSSFIHCLLNRSSEFLSLFAFSCKNEVKIMSASEHDMHRRRGIAWPYWILIILISVICRPSMCLA